MQSMYRNPPPSTGEAKYYVTTYSDAFMTEGLSANEPEGNPPVVFCPFFVVDSWLLEMNAHRSAWRASIPTGKPGLQNYGFRDGSATSRTRFSKMPLWP